MTALGGARHARRSPFLAVLTRRSREVRLTRSPTRVNLWADSSVKRTVEHPGPGERQLVLALLSKALLLSKGY